MVAPVDDQSYRDSDECDPFGNIRIIELNPFLPSTSACMFDWQRDAATLAGENLKEVELRVKTEPTADGLQFLTPKYKQLAEDWMQSALSISNSRGESS